MTSTFTWNIKGAAKLAPVTTFKLANLIYLSSCSTSVKMQGKLLFSAVTLILFGHIFSAPALGSGDSSLEPVSHISRELMVDRSNGVLGDIPIVPDHDVEILNRRCKCMQ